MIRNLHNHAFIHIKHRPSRPGFALIATLSVMVLLVMIALAMLSLSTLELRSTRNEDAMNSARANARMGLMIALGNLQTWTGPDQRITAPANVLDVDNPSLIGVWKSWEGSDHTNTGTFEGRPSAPDYDSKTNTENADLKFLSWLVSGGDDQLELGASQNLVKNEPFENSVALLAKGTLHKDDTRQVHVQPTLIKRDSNNGAIAWWVSGENQKARLPKPYEPSNDDAAGWSTLAQSHSVSDPTPFALDKLLTEPELADKGISLKSADLYANTDATTTPNQSFHDLSAVSTGLLTNSATGGWRKDLSLLTENWDSQERLDLPFFQVSEGVHTSASRAIRIEDFDHLYPAKSLIYPWSSIPSLNLEWPPSHLSGAVAGWSNLADYMTSYKRLLGNTSRPSLNTSKKQNRESKEHFNYHNTLRVAPIFSRVEWVLSYGADPVIDNNGNLFRGISKPKILLTPIITMWNPYNVEIVSPPEMEIRFDTLPQVSFKFRYNNTWQDKFHNIAKHHSFGLQPGLTDRILSYYTIRQQFSLRPGETRVFSPPVGQGFTDSTIMDLEPGLNLLSGQKINVVDNNGAQLILADTASIQTRARFNGANHYGSVHSYVAVRHNGTGYGTLPGEADNKYFLAAASFTTEVADALWPPTDPLASAELSDIKVTPFPFLTVSYGARVTAYGDTHAPRGALQANPFTLGYQSGKVAGWGTPYGIKHPVNSPYSFSYKALASGGSDSGFNMDPDTLRSYIISGSDAATGVSRATLAEIPLRPLASLGELQHWNIRHVNMDPPHAYNLIGNSDAMPLLPRDRVFISNSSGTNQYDDCYCANHLLFDDWFISSITPNPTTIGSGGTSLEDNYKSFIKGETSLTNAAYSPIPEDQINTTDSAANNKADSLYDREVGPEDSWKTIASRLEVEGMFNVNSTSVKAWRALLGHARGMRVPYYKETGNGANSWELSLSGSDSSKEDYVASRFNIASDNRAGTAGSAGGDTATEFTGYRVFDSAFIDQLAIEMVKQVRLRGPFLSLSEFVNRQLSQNTNLALAGAIQTALNEASKNVRVDPYESLKNNSSPTSEALLPEAGISEYLFPEAATGHSGYGLPGWIRQADILRPIAPVLTVRDDTFTIRAYGDHRDTTGNIIAKAVIEAVVQRSRNYVDRSDDADINTLPTSSANQTYGRRFVIKSFRWLSPDEI